MIEFDTLYRNHRKRLFHYLLRMTGDYDLSREISQESFTRCLERYGDRITAPALLYRIARNLVVDYKRKAVRSENFDEQDAVADGLSVDHQLEAMEHYREVLGALNTLSFKDREIISLVASESFSYREMASILGSTENSIKVRVHRARKRLRRALEK